MGRLGQVGTWVCVLPQLPTTLLHAELAPALKVAVVFVGWLKQSWMFNLSRSGYQMGLPASNRRGYVLGVSGQN